MARKGLALAEKPQTAEPLVLPSRLSDQEVAYLQHLDKKHTELLTAMRSALNEYLAYLSTTYQIDGSKGDKLNLDGTITRHTRVAQPAESEAVVPQQPTDVPPATITPHQRRHKP